MSDGGPASVTAFMWRSSVSKRNILVVGNGMVGHHFVGFKLDPTPPFAPEKKGKVESSIRYLKRGVLAGRHGEDVTEVRKHLQRFLDEEAGTRVHGTTGLRPIEQFRQHERSELLRLPATPFEEVHWKHAKVHRDCHLQFDKRLYSVPWRLVGQTVWVRATTK